jgi:2-keto-4-pentenoate hydratase/2-oxohepta-3-ene-1,7-dioic acid hydratase in catechol pathway
MKGKCAETFGPLGPWLVTRDEVKDVNSLPMSLDLNGKTMQKGSTATMIFKCDFILHYVSQFMVLEPGDVVTTGTPPGVGLGMNPQQFLKAGDVMKLNIEGLGTQQQKVVPFKL